MELERVLHPLELARQPDVVLRSTPNGMDFAALDAVGRTLGGWRVFSMGGGTLREEDVPAPACVYPLPTMGEMLAWREERAAPLWRIAEACEGGVVVTAPTCGACGETARGGLAHTGNIAAHPM